MRRRVLLSAGAVVVVLAAFGLYWFQPWKLFVDQTVHEALPEVAVRTTAPPTSAASPDPTVQPRATPTRRPPRERLLSHGAFISQEHGTSGEVSVVRYRDGRRVLAIADLDTSNGPDVHVWLTDAPVIAGSAGWHVFDDGRYLDLGALKGNIGDQVYAIPAAANLRRLTSVSIWCDRFDVSFGAAALHADV